MFSHSAGKVELGSWSAFIASEKSKGEFYQVRRVGIVSRSRQIHYACSCKSVRSAWKEANPAKFLYANNKLLKLEDNHGFSCKHIRRHLGREQDQRRLQYFKMKTNDDEKRKVREALLETALGLHRVTQDSEDPRLYKFYCGQALVFVIVL
jgi:hypothetical protein